MKSALHINTRIILLKYLVIFHCLEALMTPYCWHKKIYSPLSRLAKPTLKESAPILLLHHRDLAFQPHQTYLKLCFKLLCPFPFCQKYRFGQTCRKFILTQRTEITDDEIRTENLANTHPIPPHLHTKLRSQAKEEIMNEIHWTPKPIDDWIFH